MSVLTRWVAVDRREPQLFVRRSLFWSCGPRDETAAFKQTVRRKYADVCSRTWVVFSAAALLVSLRFLQLHQPRCLHCLGKMEVTVHRSCDDCSPCCLALARPLHPHWRRVDTSDPPIEQFCLFWRFVRGRVFPAQPLLGTPQLDSRKFGILETGEINSTQPAVLFFFPFLSKENVIFTVQHTNSLLAKKWHGFILLLPEIQYETCDSLCDAFFHTHFLFIFLATSSAWKLAPLTSCSEGSFVFSL